MTKENYILISLDEVRPDHLSCYGYRDNRTPNLDRLAENGVLFETVISSSCLTPVSHASILTGLNAPKHGVRMPYNKINARLVSEYFKKRAYKTAAYVGVNFLGAANGYGSGFDSFDEPRKKTAWRQTKYDSKDKHVILWGNSWMDRMFKWISQNYKERFFIWGHYFECHEGAETTLLEKGKLENDVMAEFGYYDAKIKLMDDYLFGRLHQLLSRLNIEDRTYIIVTSDHGTNLGEHPLPFNEKIGKFFPQHVTLFDCDIRVPLLINGPAFEKAKRVEGMVRSIDIMPTLLELANIKNDRSEGISLLPFIARGKAEGLTAYSEELFELRGHGDFQSVRNDRYKFIINRRTGLKEFYDLSNDPNEGDNIILKLSSYEKGLVDEWYAVCESNMLFDAKKNIKKNYKQEITEKLSSLGYI